MTRNAHGRGDAAWEADLHRRYMAGDRSAAEELYRTHAAAIHALAIRYAKATQWDYDEAKSAAHEVFFATLLPKFQPGRARLITMLYRCMVGHLRKARNRDCVIAAPRNYTGEGHKYHDVVIAARNTCGPSILAETATADPDVDAAVIYGEEQTRLKTALEKLPSRERFVVVSLYLDRQSLKQVGEALQISRQRVCQIRTRACDRLAALLTTRGAAK